MRRVTDQDILTEAIRVVQQETDLHIDQVVQENKARDLGYDAKITLKKGDQQVTFLVELKRNITDAAIGQIRHRFDAFDMPAILATRYVPAYLAKKLRTLGIQFIDTAGNAYVDTGNIFLFLYGNKLTEDKKKTEKGVFTQGGIKIIFALLCQPDLKDATYRQIADEAGVALGTVDNVLKPLQRQGYFVDLGTRGRRLERKDELFRLWVAMYADRFRPKQLIGNYTAANPIDWREQTALTQHEYWGGEVAAASLTGYLKPQVITIYTQRPANELVQRLKLARKPQGEIELRNVFWNFTVETPVLNIVPPLLVYADLMATADPRTIETAKLIYDEHLQRHLRED